MTKSIREIDSKAKTTSKNSRIIKGHRFNGTTWSSMHFVDDYINEIGEIKKVDICGGGLSSAGSSVVIKGTEGELRPIGFGVGYSGTGARGLVETLSKLGIDSIKNLEKIIFDKENYYLLFLLLAYGAEGHTPLRPDAGEWFQPGTIPSSDGCGTISAQQARANVPAKVLLLGPRIL